MTSVDTLGKRIAQARLRLGADRGKNLTQTELAEMVGVTSPTVSQWEAGSATPDLETIQRLAIVLGVAPSYLAFGPSGAEATGPRRLTEAEILAARARVAARRAADPTTAAKKPARPLVAPPKADPQPPARAAGDGHPRPRRPPKPR